jgi:hypothetical protein
MSRFGSKEEVLKSIETLFLQMQEGKMEAFEMEELVELTRELHERALILRYKSYEEQVFGIRPAAIANAPDVQAEAIAEEPALPVNHEQPAFFPAPEPVAAPESEAIPVQEDEQPVFDFAMFDEPQPEPTPEPVHVPPFPVMEDLAEVAAETELNLVPEETEPEPMVEEAPVVAPIPPVAPVHNISEDIFRNTQPTDNSLVSQWRSTKLDTLVGAFGLNEKLQCIRELFDSSSEAFNQAIQLLDNQENLSTAKQVLIGYVQQYHWDLEGELAKEFVRKIERRYA